MSLRMGVTEREERIIRKMVNEGASWKEVYAQLDDCDAAYVKANFYDVMVSEALGESTKPDTKPATTPAK